jgi:DtxR family Mn-dependent transcriptional regulator
LSRKTKIFSGFPHFGYIFLIVNTVIFHFSRSKSSKEFSGLPHVKVWYHTKSFYFRVTHRGYMKMTEGLELSPRKVEYLKYLFERDSSVKTNNLAARFGVDPSTITKTISELADAGYINHTPYRGVCLSESGRLYTEFLLRRHRILSLMLTHYGLSDEQACAEASRFESMVSRDAVDRMCHAMGHPRQGVCGKISSTAGCSACDAHDT